LRISSYPFEKFFSAVTAMATSERPLRDRLVSAHLSFAAVQERDFKNPETLAEYQKLMAMLTTVHDAEKGYVPATCAAMTDDEASAAAEQIVTVLSRLIVDG
jgi:hypothetical protein